jgi:hypothetical protein
MIKRWTLRGTRHFEDLIAVDFSVKNVGKFVRGFLLNSSSVGSDI